MSESKKCRIFAHSGLYMGETMNHDGQLLTDFVEHAADGAFTELVRRHVHLVYATALRRTHGDNGLAADVTQHVFIGLARNASRLRREGSVAGWLHHHTLYEASKALRSEQRRREREREFAIMNSTESPDAVWAQLAPVLDDALGRLAASDREALLLRFLEDCDLRAVGSALGIGEDAAQKRVARALEKLRAVLTRRGVALSAVALAGLMSEQAAVAAPAAMVTNICAASLAAAAASGAAGSVFAAKMAAILTTKTKLILAATVVAAGIAMPLVQQHRLHPREKTSRMAGLEQTTPAQANLASELRKELALLNREVARLRRQNQMLREALLSAAAVVPATALKAADVENFVAHFNAEVKKTMDAEYRLEADLKLAYLRTRLHLTDEQARLMQAFLNSAADSITKGSSQGGGKEKANDREHHVEELNRVLQTLTPDQRDSLQQYFDDDLRHLHQVSVYNTVATLMPVLQLSPQQQEQARAVLQALNDTPRYGPALSANQWEDAQKESLRVVLTQAQQLSYEQFIKVRREIYGD